MRVATGGQLAASGQAAGKGTEVVVEQQHTAICRQPLGVHMIEQVLVCGIECLQWLVRLLRLALQIELGESSGEKCHAAGHPVEGSAVCRE
jgi:hypothetical protein